MQQVLGRRQWHPTPMFLPGESQGQRSLVGCDLWGRTESDTTEVTQQQQEQVLEFGCYITTFSITESSILFLMISSCYSVLSVRLDYQGVIFSIPASAFNNSFLQCPQCHTPRVLLLPGARLVESATRFPLFLIKFHVLGRTCTLCLCG